MTTTTPAVARASAPAFPIVGLSGYARTGKDTAARALTDAGYAKHWFKQAILDFCYELNALLPDGRRWAPVYDEVGYELAKDIVPGFVDVIQDVGLAARRAIDPDVWARAAMRKVDGPAVFTDCRFPNEAQAIVDAGGVVVRISRPGVGPLRRADGRIPATETALDDWKFDLHLDNNGTESQLHYTLTMLLENLAEYRAEAARPLVQSSRDPERTASVERVRAQGGQLPGQDWYLVGESGCEFATFAEPVTILKP